MDISRLAFAGRLVAPRFVNKATEFLATRKQDVVAQFVDTSPAWTERFVDGLPVQGRLHDAPARGVTLWRAARKQ